MYISLQAVAILSLISGNGEHVKSNMAELKKKLRKLRKYRDGHRAVQKTIEDAKELLSHVEESDLKKVKLLCSILQS